MAVKIVFFIKYFPHENVTITYHFGRLARSFRASTILLAFPSSNFIKKRFQGIVSKFRTVGGIWLDR